MSAGSWESHHAITTLMYRYVECVDAADFDGIAALFEQGKITNEGVTGAIKGPTPCARALRAHQPGAPDGTTRTRHVNSNVIIDIDDHAGRRDRPLRRSWCSNRRARSRSSRSSAAATATPS